MSSSSLLRKSHIAGYAGGRVLDVPRAKPMCVLSVGMNLSTLIVTKASLEIVPVEMCIISTKCHQNVSKVLEFCVRSRVKKVLQYVTATWETVK
jgi:hypothetical protein